MPDYMDQFRPPIKGTLRQWFEPGASYQPRMNGYQLAEISEGDRGTEQTIAVMIEKAREGAHHPGIRTAAERAIRLAGVKPKDYLGELRAIYEYVKDNCRYALDPRGLEQVSGAPMTLLTTGTGDCDDLSVTVVAMAGSMGHPGAFRAVKADRERPHEFSHVYALLGHRLPQGMKWIGADVTQLNTSFGWEPPKERVLSYRDWIAVPP
jgi:hypothetical protein